MKAGLRSILHSHQGSIYYVDVVLDDGPAPDETGFTPWDRSTYTSGFSTFTEVTMDTVPDITYGGLDVDAGDLVRPSYTQLQYAADDEATARTWFESNAASLARGDVYVRIYSVETDLRDLDWFGRITARGMRTAINPATQQKAFAVDASCGLGELQGVPSEPTTDVPVGIVIARTLCHANPHNTVRLYLDASASNQYVDGSSRTSALHLRSSTEWGGPAYVQESDTATTPDDADGDYGELDAILDHIADCFGLMVTLSASTGDWLAIPATMAGEAITNAEKVVCGAPVDGGSTWSFEGISADTWTPASSSAIDDASDHGWDSAPRLSAVTIKTGGASLVRQPFPSAPVPSVDYADLPADAIATQKLIAVQAGNDHRLTIDAAFQGYSGGSITGTEYPGALRVRNVGFGGTTQWVDASGDWDASEQTLGASLATSSVTITLTGEDFHDDGTLYVDLVGDDTTAIDTSGEIRHADFSAALLISLRDSSGDTITSWRVIIGESDIPGDVADYTNAPTMEADTDGAGTWAAVTAWQSARWSTTQSVLAEYGAEAELRRRAEPLDSFDGAAQDLLGPECRPKFPTVRDMEGAGTDATDYAMGAGVVLRPDSGTTRGLWFRLPAEAL